MVLTAPPLCGWSPSTENDHEVHIPNQMYLLPKRFIASTSCITHQPVAPSSDRRAQRNRSRDPSWILRPRNAFIIFRCEYSREHSQAAQDDDGESELPNPTAKTLSKRAAEAWKQLTVSEKERYKVLAEKEREEHARLYPHYRFRPMRRQVPGVRKRPCELSTISNSSRSLDSSGLAGADDSPQGDGGTAHPHRPSSICGSFSFNDASTGLCTWECDKSIGNLPRLPPELGYQSPASQDGLTYTPSFTAISSSISSWNSDSHFSCFSEQVPSSRELLTPYEEMERAQALEAYAIGLHNFDFFTDPPPRIPRPRVRYPVRFRILGTLSRESRMITRKPRNPNRGSHLLRALP